MCFHLKVNFSAYCKMERILVDIFDKYPLKPDFIKGFLTTDDNIDIKSIISHQFLRINVLFSSIWNYVYKTFPVKKDFMMFCDTYGYNESTIVSFDNQFLERILNFKSFFPLKLGLMTTCTIENITREYLNIIQQSKDIQYVEDFIKKKLSYRFDIPYSKNNIIHACIEGLNNKRIIETELPENMNIISRNIVESIKFTENDNIYLTDYEKIQYVIYHDYHFILKLLSSTVVLVDMDLDTDTEEEETINYILNNIIKTHDRNVLLLNSYSTIHDPCYTFDDITLDLYNILPKISPAFICFSNEVYPVYDPLAIDSKDSIYCLRAPFKNNESTDKYKKYNKYILNSLEDIPNINIEKYVILDKIINENTNTIKNNTHTDIPQLYVLDTVLDDTSKLFYNINSNAIVIHSEKQENQYYDIIIASKEDTFECIRQGSIPILVGESSLYIKNYINGIIVKDIDELNKTLRVLTENSNMLNIMKKGVQMFRKYILSDEFINLLWKHHLQSSCPLKSNNPKDNILLYLDFIVYYFLEHLQYLVSITQYQKTMNCVIIVDNRPNILSVIAVLFSLCNLNETWQCIFFTSKHGYDFYNKMLGDIATIVVLDELDTKKFHIDIYNNLLKSTSLWESLETFDKCLIIQDDGILLQKGISKFLQYDYVGAPWVDTACNEYIKNNINNELVGNGGFSLRSVSMMKQITETYVDEKQILFFNDINNVPEDVYFVRYLKKMNANVSPFTEALKFASEEIINMNSIGMHKVWSYHPAKNIKEFFKNQIPSR